MKKILYSSLVLAVCFCSCKKDKDATPTPVPSSPTATTNYFPLSVGSYWIYDTYNLDTNGVETYVSTDSCYISNDTVIGGNTYSVFHASLLFPTSTYYRRDSSGYLVDQVGKIYFSNTNFTDTLRYDSLPGYFSGFGKMISPSTSVSVPAGTFSVYDFMQTTTILTSGYIWENPRITHHYYADGVGIVNETLTFVGSPGYIGRKLVRYNIL